MEFHLVLLVSPFHCLPSLLDEYTDAFHYHIVHRVRMSDRGGTFQQQLVMVGIVYYRLYSTHTHAHMHAHTQAGDIYREELGPSSDSAQGLLLMFQL